jgi:N-methylhydantoinase A/oxoprolinase/acetone carboxylase beta subunit
MVEFCKNYTPVIKKGLKRMQIILATSNKGKVREIRSLFEKDEVIPFSEILGPMEIEENGSTTLVPPGFHLEHHPSGALILSRDETEQKDSR